MMRFDYPPGATPISPEEALGLKLAHITTQAELNRWEQENISEALAWLSKQRKKNILTIQFLKELHTKMYGKVWKWAGEFRRSQKNIGVEHPYIPIRLTELLESTQYWIDNKTFPPDEIAYRFHHQLVLIHPFPNGNGRHARLMSDTLLEQVLDQERFSWGSADLTAQSDIRKAYINALQKADKHDYSALAKFVRS